MHQLNLFLKGAMASANVLTPVDLLLVKHECRSCCLFMRGVFITLVFLKGSIKKITE